MQPKTVAASTLGASACQLRARLKDRILLAFAAWAFVFCVLIVAFPAAALSTPYLTGPGDGAQVPAASQVFTWGDTYAEGTLDHWYLEISTSPMTDYYPYGYFSGNLAYASPRLTSSSVNLNAIGRALAPGIYYWHVVGYYGPLGSAGTAWTTVRSFTVQNSGVIAPTIAVNPASLTFTVAQGDPGVYAQSVAISNTGGGTLFFQASIPSPFPAWLDIIPGTNTGTIYTLPVRVYVGSLSPGAYAWKVRIADNGSSPAATNSPVDVPVTLHVLAPSLPVAGATRYETAVEASRRAYPDGASSVVVATGRNWPDALGGSALAGVVDGPVLLVDTNAVPSAVGAELDRLEAKKAFILGGEAAVGSAVESALNARFGAANVERIAGTDRYSTADAVAGRTIELAGPRFDGKAFVATGDNFPDALAAAPLAAAKEWPLYLVHPTRGLMSDTKAAMDGVNSALILGGTAVVPSEVEAYLESTYGAGKVTRLAGADRYATAVSAATYGVQQAGLGWDRVGISTGENYPDALAGGVLQGKAGSVMLLTPSTSLNAATEATLLSHKAEISTVTFFGGTNAVSQSVRTAALRAVE